MSTAAIRTIPQTVSMPRTTTTSTTTTRTARIPAVAPQPPPSSSTTDIDFPTVGSADVAVFWDFENVRLPAWCPATAASEAIRNKVAKYGRIVEKRLYYDSRQPTELSAPRSDLDLSGFTLVDCPSRGRKETLDKKLIVDVLMFSWERASLGAKACVVLITSDGDYSYALARLRDIGVFTVIIYRPDIVAKVLIDNANVVMSWEFDVLGGPPPSQGEGDYYEDDESAPSSSKPVGSDESAHSINERTEDVTPVPQPTSAEPVVKQPNLQTRGKFALFCSVVLNSQHRNVKEGISVYSSWADEANVAAIFYEKVGEKDREGYLNIRTLATKKRFIEWGRRDLSAPGKPVIKVKDRDDRAEGLSSESYVRLTHSGLAVVKPNIAAKESDWTMVLAKADPELLRPLDATASTTSPAPSRQTTPNPTSKAPRTGKLFVGGLAWETTEDSLRSYFRQFGKLEIVLVKEGRGFGYVFFRHAADAEAVLKKGEQQRHVVDHKPVDVQPYIYTKG